MCKATHGFKASSKQSEHEHTYTFEISSCEVSSFNCQITKKPFLVCFLQNILFNSHLTDQPKKTHSVSKYSKPNISNTNNLILVSW